MNEKNKKEQINKVILSTGNVNRPYVVRDIIFVTNQIDSEIYRQETNPNEVLTNVKYELKQQAFNYGANAVINCHFELRPNIDKNTIDIFAYGTVVQYIQTTIGG